jgi:hypothetical protein
MKTHKRTNSDLQTTPHNEHWKCNNQMVILLQQYFEYFLGRPADTGNA